MNRDDLRQPTDELGAMDVRAIHKAVMAALTAEHNERMDRLYRCILRTLSRCRGAYLNLVGASKASDDFRRWMNAIVLAVNEQRHFFRDLTIETQEKIMQRLDQFADAVEREVLRSLPPGEVVISSPPRDLDGGGLGHRPQGSHPADMHSTTDWTEQLYSMLNDAATAALRRNTSGDKLDEELLEQCLGVAMDSCPDSPAEAAIRLNARLRRTLDWAEEKFAHVPEIQEFVVDAQRTLQEAVGGPEEIREQFQKIERHQQLINVLQLQTMLDLIKQRFDELDRQLREQDKSTVSGLKTSPSDVVATEYHSEKAKDAAHMEMDRRLYDQIG